MSREDLIQSGYTSLGVTEEDVFCVGKLPSGLVAADIWEVLSESPDAGARDLVEQRRKLNAKQSGAVPFEAFVAAANLTKEEAVEVIKKATREALVPASTPVRELLPPIEEDVVLIADGFNSRSLDDDNLDSEVIEADDEEEI